MGLQDIVRGAVAVADSVTSTLQAPVKHYVRSEATVDDSGMVVTWGLPHVRLAIVEHARVQMRDKEGRDVVSNSQIFFPRPVEVDPLDRFELPDGTSGSPITRAGTIVNPSTGRGYYKEVMI